MPKLVEVTLHGWKGFTGTYKIQGHTVITGRNESGKSACLQGIIYALTGRVPGAATDDLGAASRLDAVAQFFSPEGGTVTVADEAGEIIERGIAVDSRNKTRSQILEMTTVLQDGKPNLDYWHTDCFVLHPEALLPLSAEKKREVLLARCGSAAPADSAAILTAIAQRYALAVGGPFAAIDKLGSPPYDLSAAIAKPGGLELTCGEYARLWPDISTALSVHSFTSQDASATTIFQRLTDGAKSERLEATADAKRAKAAADDLEAVAAPLVTCADLLPAAQEECAKAKAAAQVALQAHAVQAELVADLEGKKRAEKDAQELLNAAEWNLSRAPAPPDLASITEPELEDLGPQIQATQERAQKLREDKTRRDEIEAQGRHDYLAMTNLLERVMTLRQGIGARALAILALIPDEVHPEMPKLRTLLLQGFASLAQDLANAERALVAAEAVVEESKRTYIEVFPHPGALAEQIAANQKEMAALSLRVSQQRAAVDAARQDRAKAQADIDAYRALGAKVERLQIAADAATKARQEIEARLNAMPPNDPATVLAYESAARRVRELEQGAAKHATYMEAVARGEAARRREAAWKVAEDAIKEAREVVVVDASKPLCDAANAVYAAMGREERMYIRLENQGKPVCDLGVARGKDFRIPAVALSAGATVIFQTALAVAIARLAPGLRLLLLEADPLDAENLAAFLRASLTIEDMDAFVVATASEVDDPESAGWNVIRM